MNRSGSLDLNNFSNLDLNIPINNKVKKIENLNGNYYRKRQNSLKLSESNKKIGLFLTSKNNSQVNWKSFNENKSFLKEGR